MVIHKRLLHSVQLLAIRETLDGPDFATVGLHSEHQTGAHRLAVNNHGTGAADSVLTADVGSGLSAILTDRIGQSATWLNSNRVIAVVDIERYRGFCVHARFSALRRAARMRCGVAGISSISTPNGESASFIALIIAAGAPIVPPSPSPLALVIEFVLGVSM